MFNNSEYCKERYKKDEGFRKRKIQNNTAYRKRNKKKYNEYMREYMRRYKANARKDNPKT